LTEQELHPVTGELTTLGRLQGSGLFNDPNELGVMLAAAVLLALYLMCHSKSGLGFLYVLPLGLFLYAIALTHSRGALLALVAGLGALMFTRFGMRRAALLAVCGLPVLLAVFAGRQTNLSAMQGTGQTRLQLWSDWLGEFRANPVFGKGLTLVEDAEKAKEDQTWQGLKHAAHNSYLHGFAELGLIGGFFFLGAVGMALWSVLRLDPRRTRILDGDMRQLRPFLAGAVSAYAVGLLSLSMCYGVPTYLILGLAVAYARVTPHHPALPVERFDGRMAGRIALASVGFLAMTYVLVRVFVRWA
jgi:O-antigen ligase